MNEQDQKDTETLTH
jgi:hypothetical protein